MVQISRAGEPFSPFSWDDALPAPGMRGNCDRGSALTSVGYVSAPRHAKSNGRLRAAGELDLVDPDVELRVLLVDLELDAVELALVDAARVRVAPAFQLFHRAERDRELLPVVGEGQIGAVVVE